MAAPAGGAVAAPPQLGLPIDCRPGLDCYVQNYVDIDPGPGARDFTCGPLSYNGHRGTDIRLFDRSDMRRDTAVLAPAAGVVAAVRDGERDIGIGFDPSNKGRECGNAVRIAHDDGWQTLLCHLRQGSIRVKRGDAVTAGQPVGLVGLSGATVFPHVHLTVLHGKTVVDPYTGLSETALACGGGTGGGLWTPAAAEQLAYRASGLLGAGFADHGPNKEELRDGLLHDVTLSADAPALVFWGKVFGLRDGDVEQVRIVGPNGGILAETSATATKNRATAYRYVGKRRPGARWPAGRYVGSYTLLRGGSAIVHAERELVLP
ncbi:MAG: M23 family metallopeptidase [Alphaproteobacteria bacterium]